MDENNQLTHVVPILTMISQIYGFLIIVTIMAATVYMAASHVTRYTRGATHLNAKHLQAITVTLMMFGVSTALSTILNELNPPSSLRPLHPDQVPETPSGPHHRPRLAGGDPVEQTPAPHLRMDPDRHNGNHNRIAHRRRKRPLGPLGHHDPHHHHRHRPPPT